MNFRSYAAALARLDLGSTRPPRRRRRPSAPPPGARRSRASRAGTRGTLGSPLPTSRRHIGGKPSSHDTSEKHGDRRHRRPEVDEFLVDQAAIR